MRNQKVGSSLAVRGLGTCLLRTISGHHPLYLPSLRSDTGPRRQTGVLVLEFRQAMRDGHHRARLMCLNAPRRRRIVRRSYALRRVMADTRQGSQPMAEIHDTS